ncbi:MAG TPA: TRAP transporter small permease, partial [Candidatus Methylomirabilis sp.]|nr:TRAP transporter small permease [Candidatus Methylomirabilis sp.]
MVAEPTGGEDVTFNSVTPPRVPVLDRLLRVMGIVVLAFMLLVTFLQVIARYFVFLNWQLGWTEEVSRLLLVWLTFLGAALLQQGDGHIRLNLVSRYLGHGGRTVLRLFGDLVMLGFLLVIAYEGYWESVEGLGQTTPALQAPFTLFTASLWL